MGLHTTFKEEYMCSSRRDLREGREKKWCSPRFDANLLGNNDLLDKRE